MLYRSCCGPGQIGVTNALLIALSALVLAACSSAGSPQQYQYTQMHYEADPDNEKDPEHILTAFHKCLSSDPVLNQWRAERAQEPAAANVGSARQGEAVSAEAMKEGSRVQALVDECMARSGYPTKGFLLVR
jgi:hypothetical protein